MYTSIYVKERKRLKPFKKGEIDVSSTLGLYVMSKSVKRSELIIRDKISKLFMYITNDIWSTTKTTEIIIIEETKKEKRGK